MRLLIAVIAAAALPLFAETPKPAPETQSLSPLAAAAKRTNRLGKTPVNVITNATVGRGSGRVSWATGAAAATGPSVQAADTSAAPGASSGPAAPARRAAAPQAPKATAPTYDGSSRVTWSTPPSSTGLASPGSTVGTSTGVSTANPNALGSTAVTTSRPSSATVTSPSSAPTRPVD